MDESALKRQLAEEGFSGIFTWSDRPGAVYPDHTHAGETAHIVLAGETAVTTAAGTRTYQTGDRFDVGAGEVHSARIGPRGCTYIVGER